MPMVDRYMLLHPITRLRLKSDPPLTTEELAKLAKVHRTSLSKVEYGHRDHPGVDVCKALAKAFPELSLESLLGWRWTDRSREAARARLSEIENGRARRGGRHATR